MKIWHQTGHAVIIDMGLSLKVETQVLLNGINYEHLTN